jgi:hypothetical protein
MGLNQTPIFQDAVRVKHGGFTNPLCFTELPDRWHLISGPEGAALNHIGDGRRDLHVQKPVVAADKWIHELA